MRDRLIELLNDMQYYGVRAGEKGAIANWDIADYLLDNGIIVKPTITGKKVWYVCEGEVRFTLVEGLEPALRLIGFPRPILRQEIGTLIFLKREDAERALQSKEKE